MWNKVIEEKAGDKKKSSKKGFEKSEYVYSFRSFRIPLPVRI